MCRFLNDNSDSGNDKDRNIIGATFMGACSAVGALLSTWFILIPFIFTRPVWGGGQCRLSHSVDVERWVNSRGPHSWEKGTPAHEPASGSKVHNEHAILPLNSVLLGFELYIHGLMCYRFLRDLFLWLNTNFLCFTDINSCGVKVKVWIAQSYLTFATPWTAARQAPLSLGFSRQEYWNV